MSSTLASVLLAALATSPVLNELPFEALASELEQHAREELSLEDPEDSFEGQLRARLAPLHLRIPLGALELWSPVTTLASPGRFDAPPTARELRDHALALLELQRPWLARMGLEGDALEAAGEDLDEVARWVRGFRRREVPVASPEVRRAQARLEDALLVPPERVTDRSSSPAKLMAPAIVLAPTRAHYVALLGVVGLERTGFQDELWTDHNARTANQFPGWRTAFVGLTLGLNAESGIALTDGRYDPRLLEQTIVHLGSLLLGYNVSLELPAWFVEGVAICDTIDVCGADETVFSGHRRSESDQGLGQVATVFAWIYQENSPYRRGASEQRFLRELRKAHGEGGFAVHDLVEGGVALRAHGPFLGGGLGRGVKLPPGLVEGPPGPRYGFAELLRAYSAAFVHWLSVTAEDGERTHLERLVSELRARCMGLPARVRLAGVAQETLGLTLGASASPERDLEGRFLAWLVGADR